MNIIEEELIIIFISIINSQNFIKSAINTSNI